MKNNRILALSGNDIFSGGGLSADLATYTLDIKVRKIYPINI